MKKDIQTIDDIKLLVDSFYSKVQNDEHLSLIFNPIIGNRWAEHLEKMYRFWDTVLLSGSSYFGSPFIPHAKLPVSSIHFKQWQTLFLKR
ncbi:MAG: group III truncated hemoglobin [Chitinophagales bacterium]|nr:group III truncated hemoglobin [Chitinophagales bacterium]